MLLINHAKVYTMVDDVVYEDGYILCDGEKVLETGESFIKSGYRNRKDIEELDASGCIAMPGLVEAHCHVGITEEQKGLEGDDCNEMSDPITPQLRAIDAVNPMDAAFRSAVEAGITGIMVGPGSSNVVGGQFAFIKTYGRSIDRMIVKAPAAMKVAFGENPKSNYGGQGKIPSTRMTIAAMLREQLTDAREYAKQKTSGDGLQVDFKKEAWLPVLRREIPLKAHVHRTDDIQTAIRIAKEFDLDMTLDHCSEGHLIREEIAESGFPAIVGPAMTSRNKIEVKYVDFKTPGELKRAGVPVAITTDHPVTLIQYLPLCAGMAVKKGMDYTEALKAITIHAARICRVDDRVGSLAPGKDADIAVFDGDPLTIQTNTVYTIINGQVVWSKRDGFGEKENSISKYKSQSITKNK